MNFEFEPFYKSPEWQELLKDGYDSMSWEDKVRFVHCSVEDNHKREYYGALEFANAEGPAWEDLTDQQRANIREINDERAREMQEFGQSLARGEI